MLIILPRPVVAVLLSGFFLLGSQDADAFRGGALRPAAAWTSSTRLDAKKASDISGEPRIENSSSKARAAVSPPSSWGTAAATAAAGWALAAQVAAATTLMGGMPSAPTAPIALTEVPLQQSSVVMAGFGSYETMDFSMPSYDAATKGDTSSGSSSSSKVPSFNPFGDFEPTILKSTPAPESPAPAPAPAPATEAESTTFELKAPDISLPEFKAPSLPEFKAPSFKAPDLPDIKAPEMPKLDMPKLNFKAPDLPKFSMPSLPSSGGDGSSSFSLPSFGGGDAVDDEDDADEPSTFKAPEMPKISLPSVPEFKAPSFDGFKAPSFSMPELPKLGGGDSGGGSGMDYDLDIPKFEAPKVSMPQVSLPSFPSFGGGDSSSSPSVEEDLEPQEVRDERAREARQVYLSFDSDAKIIEQQARDARNLANEKKQLANEAKDEACKTRPGGKWICLRNPFTSGY